MKSSLYLASLLAIAFFAQAVAWAGHDDCRSRLPPLTREYQQASGVLQLMSQVSKPKSLQAEYRELFLSEAAKLYLTGHIDEAKQKAKEGREAWNKNYSFYGTLSDDQEVYEQYKSIDNTADGELLTEESFDPGRVTAKRWVEYFHERIKSIENQLKSAEDVLDKIKKLQNSGVTVKERYQKESEEKESERAGIIQEISKLPEKAQTYAESDRKSYLEWRMKRIGEHIDYI